MHDIEVITDSTCDIPQELVDLYEIHIVSHYVIWGEKQYRDRIDLQPEEFYQKLKTEKAHPTTSQATEQDFLSKYEEVILKGAKEIIVLTVSSAMSGAYQMALKAANLVKIPVHVVDSKGPTMSLGWQVLEAVRAREMGESIQTILTKIDSLRQKLVLIVGMDTMLFLQKGGRIGDAANWIGSKLQIKPVISINHTSGRVEAAGMARTYSGMVDMVYRKFFEQAGSGTKLHIAVMHGNALDEAKKLADRIVQEYNPVELLVNITGPVLGINTGPRALALSGYFE